MNISEKAFSLVEMSISIALLVIIGVGLISLFYRFFNREQLLHQSLNREQEVIFLQSYLEKKGFSSSLITLSSIRNRVNTQYLNGAQINMINHPFLIIKSDHFSQHFLSTFFSIKPKSGSDLLFLSALSNRLNQVKQIGGDEIIIDKNEPVYSHQMVAVFDQKQLVFLSVIKAKRKKDQQILTFSKNIEFKKTPKWIALFHCGILFLSDSGVLYEDQLGLSKVPLIENVDHFYVSNISDGALFKITLSIYEKSLIVVLNKVASRL